MQLRFNFSQQGFDNGASVTGTFLGEDLNSNGQISSFDDEVTSFVMDWSGNEWVSSFASDMDDLFGLVYDLDGGSLGDKEELDIEGIGVSGPEAHYLAGPGALFSVCDGSSDCGMVAVPSFSSYSSEPIVVTYQPVEQTPEPTPLAGVIGLLALAILTLRQRFKK